MNQKIKTNNYMQTEILEVHYINYYYISQAVL